VASRWLYVGSWRWLEVPGWILEAAGVSLVYDEELGWAARRESRGLPSGWAEASPTSGCTCL